MTKKQLKESSPSAILKEAHKILKRIQSIDPDSASAALRDFSSKGGKSAQALLTKAERSRRALKQWETRKKKQPNKSP